MVEVLLKDGTFLDCCIYETGNSGEFPIDDRDKIHKRFSKINRNHEDFKKDCINFQTEYINGHFHPCNVKWYSVE
jgi:hypothetical protein